MERTQPITFDFPNPVSEQMAIPFRDAQLDPFARNILLKNALKLVSGIVQGTAAATAANYGNFFVADRSYYVLAISEVHRTAGTDAGAVTISVEKAATGVAPDSGKDLLTTAINLKATANTPLFGTLTGTLADLILQKGDRLILKDSGTLTSVADVCVTVLLQEF